jgi:trimethylamine:corrinoid methyltransferase-like protein
MSDWAKPRITLLSSEQIQKVHEGSLKVLDGIGVLVDF